MILLPSPSHRRRLPALRTPAAALLLACALAVPGRASAAPPPDANSAEALASQAYAEHAAGKDAQAIATYMRAYEIGKVSVALYNVAAIYDRTLHERELAMEYYRRYVEAHDAEPALVQKATERLTALKAEQEAAAQPLPAPPPTETPTPPPAPAPAQAAALPAPAPPPPEEPPPRPGRSALRPAGVVIGAIGLAGIATSVVLGFVARGKSDDANAYCNGAACTDPRGISLAHDAGTYATAGTVTFVAGAALTATGVAMFLLAPRSSSGRAARWITVTPSVGGDAYGLRVAGTF